MPSKDDVTQQGAGEAKRVSRGYKLREDLIKALKRLAVDTDKKLYEVMEEAIEEYLERHKTKS
jgi:predicted transcriptional regulator